MSNWQILLLSAPARSASVNSFILDLAIVLGCFTKSALVIPLPLAIIKRLLFALSGTRRMKSSRLCIEFTFVRQALESAFVQASRRIAVGFSQTDLLVGVERVDEETEELGNLRLGRRFPLTG